VVQLRVVQLRLAAAKAARLKAARLKAARRRAAAKVARKRAAAKVARLPDRLVAVKAEAMPGPLVVVKAEPALARLVVAKAALRRVVPTLLAPPTRIPSLVNRVLGCRLAWPAIPLRRRIPVFAAIEPATATQTRPSGYACRRVVLPVRRAQAGQLMSVEPCLEPVQLVPMQTLTAPASMMTTIVQTLGLGSSAIEAIPEIIHASAPVLQLRRVRFLCA